MNFSRALVPVLVKKCKETIYNWYDTFAKLRVNPEDFKLVLELRAAKNYEHGVHCCLWYYI